MHRLFTMFILALLAVLPARGEGLDSLQVLLQMGDSCMQQYNTFEAQEYYQKAFICRPDGSFSMEDADVLSKYIPEDRFPVRTD